MFLLAHTGITTGMVKLVDMVGPYRTGNDEISGFQGRVSRLMNRFRNQHGTIDYRILLVGSMLPDIIDKPLAFVVKNTEIFNGRGFSHTLVFTLLLITASAIFRRSWLFLLTLGTVFHLILDSIWEMPETLFWPLMGWFPPHDTENWVSTMWEYLVSEPEVFIPESIGFIFVVWLIFRVVRGNGIIRFIRNGMIP